MANGVVIAGGVSFPLLAPNGTAAAPSYSFTNDSGAGMYLGTNALQFAVGGAAVFRLSSTGNTQVSSSGHYGWSSGAIAAASDLFLHRYAAASLLLGNVASATPIAQTFTIGEASRPGTDTNVGGASGTIRSGLGTGTGAASSIVFQTPTLVASGSLTQTYADRLTVATAAITATVPLLAPAGTAAAPAIAFSSEATGFYLLAASNIALSIAGTGYVNFGSGPISSASNVRWCWSSGALGGALDLGWGRNSAGVMEVNDGTSGTFRDLVARSLFIGALDLGLSRLAAASLRIGLAPSATPIAQTLTVGEFSRSGTDLNVAGSNGTIRPGTGTGNSTGASLIFQTPSANPPGTVLQSYATRLTLSEAGAVFDLVNQGLRINGQTSGAGASAGTLTNAPSAGDPSFWLPISIAGAIRYIPCWT